MTVTSMDATLKDLYAEPGARLKQWVVDTRRHDAWQRKTCPRLFMPPHDDNTGMPCCDGGLKALWRDLARHDCCYHCNDRAEGVKDEPRIVAWVAEDAIRNAEITKDRSILSDEIQEDYALRDGPIARLLTGAKPKYVKEEP